MKNREYIINKLKKVKITQHNLMPDQNTDNKIYSDYPDKKSLLDLFKIRFSELKGELYLVADIPSAGNKLQGIFESNQLNMCITYPSEFINNIILNIQNTSIQFDLLQNQKMSSQKFSEYHVGLTTADYLVARTGSIVLNSGNHGGRRLSVLPPVHIVVATSNQLVESLDSIFSQNYSTGNWSYVTIISGPSRTSDIEKQLVLGAHGPKRLIVILIENL